MSIVPIDKFDLDSVKKLQSCSDSEVLPHVIELLTWVQDINWPVAIPICKRLSELGKTIAEPIASVLNSDDPVWKYNVITQIVTEFSDSIPKEIIEPIIRIINFPNEGEKLEEVDMAAKDIMVRCNHGL